jgi:hypothetical protein
MFLDNRIPQQIQPSNYKHVIYRQIYKIFRTKQLQFNSFKEKSTNNQIRIDVLI